MLLAALAATACTAVAALLAVALLPAVTAWPDRVCHDVELSDRPYGIVALNDELAGDWAFLGGLVLQSLFHAACLSAVYRVMTRLRLA
jgi:hypothetical protein